MSKIKEFISKLPNLYTLKAATETEIVDAEIQLRTKFSDEYREYLLNFGAIMADGIELSGIAKSEHRNVVVLTKLERELNPAVTNDMYVVENTHIDGIIIWQNSSGSIFKTTPHSKVEKIAPSLYEYLLTKSY